jgi:hypothetical protein
MPPFQFPTWCLKPSLLLYLLATSSLMPLHTLDINICLISGFQLINGCDIQLATQVIKNLFLISKACLRNLSLNALGVLNIVMEECEWPYFMGFLFDSDCVGLCKGNLSSPTYDQVYFLYLLKTLFFNGLL